MKYLLKKYDVFISYAIEDKYTVAIPLQRELVKLGIRPFLLGNGLNVGDSIFKSIYDGLRSSSHCIVILSADYKRYWTLAEMHEFRKREFQKKAKLLLPVWHKITYRQLNNRFPWLNDTYGISTKEGIPVAAKMLEAAIKKRRRTRRIRTAVRSTAALIILSVLLILAPYIMGLVSPPVLLPSHETVKKAVDARISDCQEEWEYDLNNISCTKEIKLNSAIEMFRVFKNLPGKESNEYKISDPNSSAIAKKSLNLLGFPFIDAPYKAYGMAKYLIAENCSYKGFNKDGSFNYHYIISNKIPVSYQIDTIISTGPGEAIARVTFKEFLRHVYERLEYYPFMEREENRKLTLMTFMPTEELAFEMKKGEWIIRK